MQLINFAATLLQVSGGLASRGGGGSRQQQAVCAAGSGGLGSGEGRGTSGGGLAGGRGRRLNAPPANLLGSASLCFGPAPVPHSPPFSHTAPLLYPSSPACSRLRLSVSVRAVGLFPGDHPDCAQQPVPRDRPAGPWWPAADVNLMPGSHTCFPWNMRVSHSDGSSSSSSSRRRADAAAAARVHVQNEWSQESFCRRVLRDLLCM